MVIIPFPYSTGPSGPVSDREEVAFLMCVASFGICMLGGALVGYLTARGDGVHEAVLGGVAGLAVWVTLLVFGALLWAMVSLAKRIGLGWFGLVMAVPTVAVVATLWALR